MCPACVASATVVVGSVVSGGGVAAVVAKVWKTKFQRGKLSKLQKERHDAAKPFTETLKP